MSQHRNRTTLSLALGLTLLLGVSSAPAWAGEQTYSGALDASSPTWIRPTRFNPPQDSGSVNRYSAQSFQVSAADTCTLTMVDVSGGGTDGYFEFYKDSFDAANKYANGLATDDDSAGGLRPQITQTLQPGTTYILVTTQFGGSFDMAYTNRISCPTATVTLAAAPPTTTCASEGYTGMKLDWCKNICERDYTGATLNMWIRRWIDRYRILPYCALAPQPVPTVR